MKFVNNDGLGSTSSIFVIVVVVVVLALTSFVPSTEAQMGFEDDKLDLMKNVSYIRELDRIVEAAVPGVSKYLKPSEGRSNPSWLSFLRSLREAAASNVRTVSKICEKSVLDFVHGLETHQLWAIQMIDSYGRPGEGVLTGNVKWPGRYSECLKSIAKSEDDGKDMYSGKYCWLHLPDIVASMSQTKNFGISVKMGICVPDTCDTQEVDAIIKQMTLTLPFPFGNTSTSTSCLLQSELKSDSRAVLSVTILASFLAFVVLATIYDILTSCGKSAPSTGTSTGSSQKEDTKIQDSTLTDKKAKKTHVKTSVMTEVITSFSIYSNASKVLSLSEKDENLTCINGVRVLSMLWVMLGHTYLTFQLGSDNLMDVHNFMGSYIGHSVIQATLSVDTFFVMSGLLVCYVYFEALEKSGGRMSWAVFYLHRFWRLGVAYSAVLFLMVPTFKYWGAGPYWEDLDKGSCDKHWWRNLLYINNYWPLRESCMGHTWFLANEIQLYMFSPILLIPLKKKPLRALFIGIVLMIASWVITGAISWSHNIPCLYSSSAALEIFEVMFEQIYIKPYCRIGAYLVGMAGGYLLYITKRKAVISTPFLIFAWSGSIFSGFFALYGNYVVDLPEELGLVYLGVSRTMWSMSACWIIFACCSGYGGFMNRFLAASIWGPFSRITYCAFLIHLYLFFFFINNQEVLPHFSISLMFFYFIGNVVVAYTGALILSLGFEAPVLALERILLRRVDIKSD